MFLCQIPSVISAAVVIVAFEVQKGRNAAREFQRTTVPLNGRETRSLQHGSVCGLTLFMSPHHFRGYPESIWPPPRLPRFSMLFWFYLITQTSAKAAKAAGRFVLSTERNVAKIFAATKWKQSPANSPLLSRQCFAKQQFEIQYEQQGVSFIIWILLQQA